ncbi:hypothetical protein HG531_007540 [Fusarium graminearum]|nr:hypothetical protein HG531_007540 [Fusarium graminearum]
MGRGRAQKSPVSDCDKEYTCASIEHIVTDAILLVDTRTSSTGDIGRSGGQGNNVTHQKRVPNLARKTPVQRIVGGLSRRRDEDDIAMLFYTGVA